MGQQSDKLEFEEKIAAVEARLRAEHAAQTAAMMASHASVVDGFHRDQAAANAKIMVLGSELENKTAELDHQVKLVARLESSANIAAEGRERREQKRTEAETTAVAET